MNTNEYISMLKDPGPEYRPSVMWFWNDDISEKEIEFQLGEMRKAGIYHFFIHPMYGLTVEYLSERFFELIRHAVMTAKRLGMKFWIYDEYNWPSGQAGGKLIAKGDDYCSKSLNKTPAVLKNGLYEADVIGKFLHATAVTRQNGVFAAEDITQEVSERDGKLFFDPKGRNFDEVLFFQLFTLQAVLSTSAWSKYSENRPGLADLYNPEVSAEYIRLTYDGYKRAVGDEFGKTVLGSFTDEDYPTSPFEVGEGRLPWPSNFENTFREKYGYDILPKVHLLHYPSDTDEAVRVKDAYWSLLKEIYFKNFLIPLSDYCKENGLQLTGHLQGGGMMMWELTDIGDFWEGLCLFDMPGCDSVCPPSEINMPGYGQMISARLRTVTKYFKKDRVICEAFSGSGWDFTLEYMKRVGNHLIVNGCNNIQYMGGYFSLNNTRKQLPVGYPPSHNYNNPIFPYYKEYGDYIAGMSWLSSVTKADARILSFIPLSEAKQTVDMSVQLLAHYRWGDCSFEHAESAIERMLENLLRLGIGIDVIPETQAGNVTADAESGTALCFGYEYDWLVFPAMHYCKADVRRVFDEARKAGVKILLINADLAVTTETAKRFEDDFCFAELYSNGKMKLSAYKNVFLISYEGPTPDLTAYRDVLDRVFADYERFVVNETEDKVIAIRRSNDETDAFFIANDESRPAEVILTGKGAESIFVTPVGGRKDIQFKNGKKVLRLEGHEMVIGLRDKKEPFSEPAKEAALIPSGAASVAAGGLDIKLLCPNRLIPKIFVSQNGRFEETTFGTDLQSTTDLRPGSRAVFKLTFDMAKASSMPIKLFAETEWLEKISVNGNALSVRANTRLWGPYNMSADVTGYLVQGENEIILDVRFPDWEFPFIPPFVFLEGSFSVRDNIICPACEPVYGNLAEKGFPCYSGDICYGFDYVHENGEKAFLEFETPEMPCRVTVNGLPAGAVLWRPYRLELTGLKEGSNRIEIIYTESYNNLFAYSRHPGNTDGLTHIGLSGITVKKYKI